MNRDLPSQSVQEKLLYTMAEAAEQLSISRQFMYTLVQQHHIPTLTLGRARRVRRVDLVAFVDQLATLQ